MQGSSYQSITLVLLAGETRAVMAYGRYLRILDNSIATHPQVKIADNPEQELQAGVGIEIFGGQENSFSNVLVRNPAAGVMTLKIAISSGQIDDSRLTLTGTILTQPAQTATGTDAADITTGAAAKVFSSASCKSVLIQADFTNGANVFLGFANTVSATRKVIALSAGMAFQFDNFNGDIWAYSAAAQKISVSSW